MYIYRFCLLPNPQSMYIHVSNPKHKTIIIKSPKLSLGYVRQCEKSVFSRIRTNILFFHIFILGWSFSVFRACLYKEKSLTLTDVSRPDRLRDIADRFNVDHDAVLDNVLYARAYTSKTIMQLPWYLWFFSVLIVFSCLSEIARLRMVNYILLLAKEVTS